MLWLVRCFAGGHGMPWLAVSARATMDTTCECREHFVSSVMCRDCCGISSGSVYFFIMLHEIGEYQVVVYLRWLTRCYDKWLSLIAE